MTEVATIERPQRREITQVVDAVPILDSARFEHMQRIANVIARSSMLPESLCTVGPKDHKQDLPYEQVLSNCFLVVNQAARWGMDPFAVISCCAVVHGRLSYEGKLVAAVLDAKLGVTLHHFFTGEANSEAYRIYLSDAPFTDEIIAQLKPGITIPGINLWDGSVGEWKTSGAGTPWTVKNYRRMLIYRGTRDWARVYKPAMMLGVYTDDELLDLVEDARARRAAPVVSLAERLALGKKPEGETNGFSAEHVERQTNGDIEHEATPAQDSVSAQDHSQPPGPSPEATPATEAPLSDVAGDNLQTQESSAMQAADDVGQADGATETSQEPRVGLPEGWEKQYALALRRATKAASLPKLATQFWESQPLSWPQVANGDYGPTAAAIFEAFKNNFGDKAKIDAALRELEALP
jgi:hypothetical protein